MFTGITSQVGALVTAIVVLTGTAILRGGAAAADSNQDDRFLALLNDKGIPALTNVPSLIATAHKVCRELDDGMPADGIVDEMVNHAYKIDPNERQYPPGRLARTEARFITAAVEAYCPGNKSKVASIMVNYAPGSNESTHRFAAYTQNAVNSGGDLREPPPALDMIHIPAATQEPTRSGVVRLPHVMNGGVFVGGRYGDDGPDREVRRTVLASLIVVPPEGDNVPNPPPIPPPPPPPAQHLIPLPIAAPPPPKQPPPRPEQPPPPPKQPPPPPEQPPPPPEQPPPPPEQPPPPQEPPPPAVGPGPGGAPGSGGPGSGGGGNGGGGNGGGGSGGGGNGGGGNGGGRPAEPAQPMPPGFVRLAP